MRVQDMPEYKDVLCLATQEIVEKIVDGCQFVESDEASHPIIDLLFAIKAAIATGGDSMPSVEKTVEEIRSMVRVIETTGADDKILLSSIRNEVMDAIHSAAHYVQVRGKEVVDENRDH